MNALQRRRQMMLAEKSSPTGALYPLPDVDDGGLKISGGNHVVFSPSGMAYINLTAGTYGPVSVINNRPSAFVIPAGMNVVYTINMIDWSATATAQWASNFRRANGTSSGDLGTGNVKQSGIVTVNKTFSSNQNVGCFFVYLTNALSCEFEISLYVDGVQYI